MRVDDYVCLVRTVPEDSKKYGVKVCCAGFSEELRAFLRVYPLPIKNPIHQRSVCSLELERPNHDSRIESWRLKREREDDGIVETGRELDKGNIIQWFDKNLSPSIACLNASRRSLGVLKPKMWQPRFRNVVEAKPDEQFLFGDIIDTFGEEAARFTPYIRFQDADGGHELQLREWGCYEWMRRQPDRIGQLWDNLALTNADYEQYFVVGNMCNRRNVWLLLNTFRMKKERTLFSGLEQL